MMGEECWRPPIWDHDALHFELNLNPKHWSKIFHLPCAKHVNNNNIYIYIYIYTYINFNYTSYTPYLAGSAAYLAGLIALHLLALLSSYIITV